PPRPPDRPRTRTPPTPPARRQPPARRWSAPASALVLGGLGHAVAGRRLPAGLLLLALDQLALEDLAGGVAGQLVEELDLARGLVAGEVLLHVALQLILAGVLAVAEHHEGLEPLPELL